MSPLATRGGAGVLFLCFYHIGAMRRFLLLSSVDDSGTHQRYWLDRPKLRQFDLGLVYFGNSPSKFKEDGEYYLQRNGTKFENLSELVDAHYSRISQYDAIFIPDDDIEMGTEAINHLFQLFTKYELWLGAPAYRAGSKISHKITVRNSLTVLRYTNFVETGVALFSRAAFSVCFPSFAETKTGWGVDFAWPQILGSPHDKIAIIDAAPCFHGVRARGSTLDVKYARYRHRMEGRALLQKYGLLNEEDNITPVRRDALPREYGRVYSPVALSFWLLFALVPLLCAAALVYRFICVRFNLVGRMLWVVYDAVGYTPYPYAGSKAHGV